MQLETKQNVENVVKKPTLSIGSIILGICLISIPIIVTLFIAIPSLGQTLLQEKSEIMKGMIIGITILPVFLFVAIKGGKLWYKQWWSWVAVGVTCIALVSITFIGSFGGSNQSMDNGMNMEDGMNMGGDMGMSDDMKSEAIIME